MKRCKYCGGIIYKRFIERLEENYHPICLERSTKKLESIKQGMVKLS